MEIGSGAQMEGWQGMSAFITEKTKNKGNAIASFITFLVRGQKSSYLGKKRRNLGPNCGNPEEVPLRPKTHIISLTLAK